MATAFSPEEIELEIKSVLEKRDQEIIFWITKELIKFHFSDEDGNPDFQKFNILKSIVQYWYENKITLLNISDKRYKRLIRFEDSKIIVNTIKLGINPQYNTSEFIRPIFNYYNKFGSTVYVNGNTSKEVFKTTKSHVNYVVMDSGWEGKAAKALDELPNVISYVKNNFLGFEIPYVKDGKERKYIPDFLVRFADKNGEEKNLIIEISGFNKDKYEKKWYVENRWLPAVNSVKDKYDYPEWGFIEISDDIRDVKNKIIEKISSM